MMLHQEVDAKKPGTKNDSGLFRNSELKLLSQYFF